jgi:hypothetical protein
VLYRLATPNRARQSAGGVGIARAAGGDDARSPPVPSELAGTAARTTVMPSGSTLGPGTGAAGIAAAAAGRSGSGAGAGELPVTAPPTAGAAGRGGGGSASAGWRDAAEDALAEELPGATVSVPPLLPERGG